MAPSGTVTRIEHQGREIYLIGTAHVSQNSVDEVKRVIAEVEPDTVCVELDQPRYDSMMDESRWRRLDLFQIIRQKRVLYFISNLALSAYQRKIGESMGVKPGAELLAAVKAAESIGARLVLADRDIQATLKRTWHQLGFWNKSRLVGMLLMIPFAVEEIAAEKIDALRDRDTISEVLDELAKEMPDLKRPLIDERDQYLIDSIVNAPGKKIVAVVGAGHVRGMLANLDTKVDRELLSRIPPPSSLGRIISWAIPVVILGAFYFGWQKHETESLMEMVRAWVLPTSIGCGVLTLAAFAHPLTVLSGVLAAPLTTLNPMIGAGMVTALVEAWLRRPTVEDCEQVPDAIMKPRMWLKNRATRVLLVFVLSNLGASIGMFISTTWVLSLLR
ncbi:MAG TPA: TraB/GumN family protein [Polyangiaceae bacterium]|nr:TraB/GumN family protein [Polyangiaceae bacterium]